MTDGGDIVDPAFTVARPAAPGRFVFASPHSGAVYPDDLGGDPDLPEEALRSAEDALVDRLIAPGLEHGAVLVTGRMGRAYLDLNRDPGELDPALIDGVETPPSPRALAGYGVLPRLCGDGRPIYARRLPLAEALDRVERVHRPYHQALAAEMTATRERRGAAVLVDWHSMPARAAQAPGGPRGPDVILGDRHGSSCSAELTQTLRRAFEALGWRVALNHPYAGGYTTQIWGRPDEGFHAIQVELNRALYFDEAARAPGPGWSRTAKGVAQAIARLTLGA